MEPKGKAERFWAAYRRISNFPWKSTNPTERKVGLIFYVICTGIALVLIFGMFTGQTRTYVDYRTSGGDFQPSDPFQPPDFVVCPATRKSTTRNYTLWYDEDMIQELSISDQDINLIAETYFSGCENGKKCPELSEPCSNNAHLSRYCEALEEIVPRALNASKNRKPAVLEHFLDSGKLHMLWIAVINHRYAAVQRVHKSLFPDREEALLNSRINFHFVQNGLQQNKKIKLRVEAHEGNMWFQQRFCAYVLGSDIGPGKFPEIGFENTPVKEPFIYWIGNLETTKLTLAKFTSNYDLKTPANKGFEFLSRVGDVVLFNAIAVTDHTGTEVGKACTEQPLIRGIEFCQLRPANETRWHYDLSFQKRRTEKVWIYPQTVHFIDQHRSFTPYTQFQLGGSLLSCFVGFSFLQALEWSMNLVRKKTSLSPNAVSRIRITAIAAMVLVSVPLTGFDLYSYISSRYTKVFTEKPANAVIPILQFCTDANPSFGFINTSKLDEYGASVDFYSFLRYAGWHMTPYINIAYQELRNTEQTVIGFQIQKWMRANWVPEISSRTKCVLRKQKMAYDEKTWVLKRTRVFELCFEDYIPWIKYVIPARVVTAMRPINLTEHVEFMGRFGKEIEAMAVKIGKPEAKIVDFLEFFALDPRLTLRCEVSGLAVPDCGQFARYFIGMHNEQCLALQIPAQKTKPTSVRVGYDGEVYELHSDFRSYYGPGTFEEKTKRYRVTACKFASPIVRAYNKSDCPPRRSWLLKAVNPTWGMDYLQIQHDFHGPIAHHAHSARVQTRLNSRLHNCLSSDALMCRFPNEHVPAVFKALQYEIWCGCSFCASTKDAAFFASMEHILGRKAECCDGKTYLNCYTRYLKKTTLRDEAKKTIKMNFQTVYKYFPIKNFFLFDDDNTYIVKNFVYVPPEFSDTRLLAEFAEENLSDWLHRASDLAGDVRSRLVDYVRKCFSQRPCMEEAFNLVSYQDDPIAEPSLNFTLVLDDEVGAGSEEIDRLDPAELLGVFFCSFGLFIGIGAVGILELIITACGKGQVSKTFHEHLLRGIGLVSREGAVVEPDAENGDGPKADVSELKTPTSGAGISETKAKAYDHKILLIALVVLSICMFGMLFYFFRTLENHEYSAELVVSPSYEQPSVGLCVESASEAQELMRVLAESTCKRNDGPEEGCDAVFNQYIHVKKDRFCFLFDRSGTQHRVDQDKPDLDLVVPRGRMPSVGLIVQGLNGSSPENLDPQEIWGEEDIVITYTTKRHHLESGKCQRKLRVKECPNCEGNFIEGSEGICCLRAQKTSGFNREKTCDRYKYSVSVKTEAPSMEKTKRLSLAVSTDNMIIYNLKQKYDPAAVISMVGGFVGSFTEITVLSLAALFGLIVWNEIVVLYLRRRSNPDLEKDEGVPAPKVAWS